MSVIHPSSIVDPQAELAEGVIIGPQCVVQGPVKIGSGTQLLHRVTLQGPLTIGKNNRIYPNATLGLEPQDRKYDMNKGGAGTLIGDDNILREGVTIHRATGDHPTTVGSRNFLMVNSHLAHDVTIGNDITMANGTLIAGHVTIEDRAVFGGNAVVHQFCRIGRMAMMSGIRGVTQDVPPFCVVYHSKRVGSLNLIGLRRAGYRASIDPLKKAFEILYRMGLPTNAAVKRIEAELGTDPLCAEFAAFCKASKRGVTPYGDSDEVTDETT
jgi:UDP-N-acetylglucosamine acyltransferase